MRLTAKRRAILLALYDCKYGLSTGEVTKRVHILDGGYSTNCTYQSLDRLLKLGFVTKNRWHGLNNATCIWKLTDEGTRLVESIRNGAVND